MPKAPSGPPHPTPQEEARLLCCLLLSTMSQVGFPSPLFFYLIHHTASLPSPLSLTHTHTPHTHTNPVLTLGRWGERARVIVSSELFKRIVCLNLEDTVSFLIIQNFQTLYYHIKDTRCQHLAQVESQHGKFQWAWVSVRLLRVKPSPACPSLCS